MMSADAVRVTTTDLLQGRLRLDLLSSAACNPGIAIRLKRVGNRFFDRLRRRRLDEHTVHPSFPDRRLCSSVAARAGNDEAHIGELWLGPDKLEQLEPADRLHSPIGN